MKAISIKNKPTYIFSLPRYIPKINNPMVTAPKTKVTIVKHIHLSHLGIFSSSLIYKLPSNIKSTKSSIKNSILFAPLPLILI